MHTFVTKIIKISPDNLLYVARHFLDTNLYIVHKVFTSLHLCGYAYFIALINFSFFIKLLSTDHLELEDEFEKYHIYNLTYVQISIENKQYKRR